MVWFPWNDNDRGLFQVLNNICRSSSYVYNVVLFSLRSFYRSRVKIENGWFIAKNSLQRQTTPWNFESRYLVFMLELDLCSLRLHKTLTSRSHWWDNISIPSTKARPLTAFGRKYPKKYPKISFSQQCRAKKT